MKYKIIAFVLFLFPSAIAFRFAQIIGGGNFSFGEKSRIGFSWIRTTSLHLGEDAKIGSMNIVHVDSAYLGNRAKIVRFNIIKGRIDLVLRDDAIINKQNKITSGLLNVRKSKLWIGVNTIIGVGNILDMTHNISLGDNSILAGVGSQLWTHGFYHSKQGPDRWRIDASINIGHNVYVGSRCIILGGIDIIDATTIGAGCVISKSINKSGLYVNQALRYIPFDPDEIIHNKGFSESKIFEKQST